MKDTTEQEELMAIHKKVSGLYGAVGGKETSRRHGGSEYYRKLAKKSHAAKRANKLKSSSDT
ncbi:MAG: hypothetical protein HOA84_03325 [Candidatus Jacksonbacteria bacterium]|jgi:hypothetical protein|nr:hypothetical protein [Candidatus Jacksonbacteria bacterium]